MSSENKDNTTQPEGLEGAQAAAAQQQEEPIETTATTATATANTSASGLGEYFDKMTKLYGEEYVKQVIEMANQDEFTVTLNILDPSGKTEPDPIDPEVQRPIVTGTEDKKYKIHPLNPMDFQRAEKLRARFNTDAKDRDKIIDNQIAVYKFLAFCYLKMIPAEFDRLYDWGQLKMAVDACDFKTLYRPQKKKQ